MKYSKVLPKDQHPIKATYKQTKYYKDQHHGQRDHNITQTIFPKPMRCLIEEHP